jgi:hypothetical protein
VRRVRRWWRRGRLVWSEPARPRWLKINPRASGHTDGLQPGDTTLGMDAVKFLEEPEPGEADREG